MNTCAAFRNQNFGEKWGQGIKLVEGGNGRGKRAAPSECLYVPKKNSLSISGRSSVVRGRTVS